MNNNSNKTQESYQISLNFEGTDILVTLNDLQLAVALLNDPDLANNFLKDNGYIPSTSQRPQNEPKNQVPEPKNQVPAEETNCEIIWSKKKPTKTDLEATALLLHHREKMRSEFDDKKTNKTKLWYKISNEMKDNKYNLGDSGGERCRQKFANLTKSYLVYIKHQKTTGTEKTEVPPFFEELHSILGSKHKINPVQLEDSMEAEIQLGELPNQDLAKRQANDTTPTTSKNFQERFKNARRRITPLTKSEIMINELKNDRQVRFEEFSFFKEHLQKTEEQRDRLLNVLERALKRKRDSDDD